MSSSEIVDVLLRVVGYVLEISVYNSLVMLGNANSDVGNRIVSILNPKGIDPRTSRKMVDGLDLFSHLIYRISVNTFVMRRS